MSELVINPIMEAPDAWEYPDVAAIAKRRLKRMRVLENDPELLVAVKQVYANDPIKFIDDWAITYDPRRQPAIMPFIMFPHQRELIEWFRQRDIRREDGIVEKSRDTGVTWLAVCYAVWSWLFQPGSKVAFGSRKEKLVDAPGDPDSIIEKARMLIRLLPPQLRPPGMTERDLSFCKLKNRSNGATITGEAGKQIGRGGRNTVYFIDEAAFLEQPESVEAALSANCDCKLYVSTPNRPGGPFFRYRHSGRYPVFTFHWRDDPRKDEAWAKGMRDKLEPWQYAREVEIDYHASMQDVCIPARWVAAAQQIRDYMHIEKGTRMVGGLDVGAGDNAECVFVARAGPVVLMPRFWKGHNTTVSTRMTVDLYREYELERLNYDEIGVGAGVSATFGEYDDLKIFPINAGDRPTTQVWPDGKRAREKFANLKAELWWRMRDRFEKTYETWLSCTGAAQSTRYPAEDLIALPPGTYPLVMQLSSVRAWPNNAGKITIESKAELHKRGVPSPDHAEALMLSMAPPARIAYVRGFHV